MLKCQSCRSYGDGKPTETVSQKGFLNQEQPAHAPGQLFLQSLAPDSGALTITPHLYRFYINFDLRCARGWLSFC